MLKRFSSILLIFSVSVMGYLTYNTYFSSTDSSLAMMKQEQVDKAREFIQAEEYWEAIEIIQKEMAGIDENHKNFKTWLELGVLSYSKIGDLKSLNTIYNSYPNTFNDNEEASLLIATSCVYSKEPRDYEKIRANWKGEETKDAEWFLLDVEYLKAVREKEKAKTLVQSQKLTGKHEARRLLSFGYLVAEESIEKAWDILKEAYKVDPESADIRTAFGRLAETAGNHSVAQQEYQAAHVLNPKDPVMRHQLADFYRRHGHFDLAERVWAGGMKSPSVDEMWLKAFFWSKVAIPIKLEVETKDVPFGQSDELVKYIMQLPKNTFWDEKTYNPLKKGGMYLSRNQETFWLRLLQYFEEGKDQEAFDLLSGNIFASKSWQPELEVQLKRVLAYRLADSFNYFAVEETQEIDDFEHQSFFNERFLPQPLRHQIFAKLNSLSNDASKASGVVNIEPSMKAFLKSDDIIPALFLAAGWLEAALQIQKNTKIDPDRPEWLAFGLSQALFKTRGPSVALAFAVQQQRTDPMILLVGEYLITLKQFDEGIEQLNPLLQKNNEYSSYAVQLAAEALINVKKYSKAKQIINDNEVFKNSKTAIELLARIAFNDGDEETAHRLYLSIEDRSIEAKTYLAKRSYDRGNYGRAEDITKELIRIFPQHPVYRESLEVIKKAKEEKNVQ
jgi:tetratricopeptide (TPR) repeat protein